MSGFENIIGATVGFVMIIALFTGSFILFNKNILNNQEILQDTLNDRFDDNKEEFDLNNVFLDSGRAKFYIENKGETVNFQKSGANCFEYFFNNYYVAQNFIDLTVNNSLRGEYTKLLNGQNGYLYLIINSMLINSDDVFKIISCSGKRYVLEQGNMKVDWYNNEFLEKAVVTIPNQVAERENEVVQIDIGSLVNMSEFKNSEFTTYYPIKQHLVLDLPFDKYNQALRDYSRLSSNFHLGNTAGIENIDPKTNKGVILEGLDFDTNDIVSGSFTMNNKPKTISFWFKSISDLNSTSVKKTFFDFDSEYKIGFNHKGNGEIGFYHYNGASVMDFDITTMTNSWNKGIWYNVIVVINNNDEHKIVINGDVEKTSSSLLTSGVRNDLEIGNMG